MGIRIFISRLDVHFIISYARKLIYQNIIIIELSKKSSFFNPVTPLSIYEVIYHCHQTKTKYK